MYTGRACRLDIVWQDEEIRSTSNMGASHLKMESKRIWVIYIVEFITIVSRDF